MIVIAGRARIQTSEKENAVRAGSVMAVASRDEPGCVDYRFGIDIEDPLVVHVFEQWESAEALEAHFTTPHFAAFAEVIAARRGRADRPDALRGLVCRTAIRVERRVL